MVFHIIIQLINFPKTKVDLLDSDGFSALYWASKKSTSKVIEALLSKGCDPNERDMHGMTALFAAVASQIIDNVSTLLSHPDIDVNQPNQFGGSALHHTAFATDRVDIAELLINAGANLFLYDYENKTPLHVARLRKRKKVFRYLKSKMVEEEPTWKCDVSEDNWDSATDGTECSVSTESKEESFNLNANASSNTLNPAQMKHHSAGSDSYSPPSAASPYRDEEVIPNISKLPLLSLANGNASSITNGNGTDSAPATSLNDHHSMESNFSQNSTDSSKSSGRIESVGDYGLVEEEMESEISHVVSLSHQSMRLRYHHHHHHHHRSSPF